VIEFLAHRGFWKLSEEKNTFESLKSALNSGFGIETDLRDLNGQLVISHDVPTHGVLTCEEFLSYYKHGGYSSTLALNIKSDGLQELIKGLVKKLDIKTAVFFDMSVPDTLGYRDLMMPFLIRISEYERVNSLIEHSSGVWVDELEVEWVTKSAWQKILSIHQNIYIVSPELHGRDHSKLWAQLHELHTENKQSNFYLCTDFPDKAKGYFNV
jgi:hypothetical protein